MKLATFTHHGITRLGAVVDDELVDLASARPDLPHEMVALLHGGAPALAAARDAVAQARQRIPLSQVTLNAPIARPPKFLAIGLNYAEHVKEGGREMPAFPVFFNKQSTCVCGPRDPFHIPRVSAMVDYEGELGFVIGRRCRHVPKQRAHEVIAGYLIVNDVSVRDWQKMSPTMTLGKSFDTHGPIGPFLVTPDEIGDPHQLSIRTLVNGELRQDSNTKHMVLSCFDQVEWVSKVCTLEPGDIITTGTPAGAGAFMSPPRFLQAGDVVRVEIERIGYLENRAIPEPETTLSI
jgi:2-keto-4-pentenoate hydratase/2-oxohepta-3-ene-1,7-dioic acid hydratase in catechol pathway